MPLRHAFSNYQIINHIFSFFKKTVKIIKHIWRVRQAVKPQPSQGCITGSSPVRATICLLSLYLKAFYLLLTLNM